MYKRNFDTNNIIQIIINQEHKIEYSNISDEESYDYLKKLNIIEKLPVHLTVKYDLENYFICIDRFYIFGEIYYIVMIGLKSFKCYSCNKMLIDNVTGLYNRNYWEQINGKIQYNLPFENLSLILIDIDDLKKINDNYGHLEGDKAIKVVGQAIQMSIRKEDIGIRYGGDEFIILIFNKDKSTINEVIKKIRRKIYEKTIEGNINIQISVGTASHDHSCNIEDIMEAADEELYKEKKMKKREKLHKEKDTLEALRMQIEVVIDELNTKVIQNNRVISNEEIVKLSQKLDNLVVRYLKDSY